MTLTKSKFCIDLSIRFYIYNQVSVSLNHKLLHQNLQNLQNKGQIDI